MPRDVAVAQPRAEEVTRRPPAGAEARCTPCAAMRGPAAGPAGHASAVERALCGDADRGGRRLQPLARHRRDALARGRDARRLGLLRLPRDVAERRGLVRHAAARRAPPPTITRRSSARTAPSSSAATARSTTTLEVLVSAEDDGEVRRVTLTNTGRRPREIEVTSYAELVLATPAADSAHPAFSKMFVQTEHLPEFGALIATRRPRSPDEAPVWAAHFAVVEGEHGRRCRSTRPTAPGSSAAGRGVAARRRDHPDRAAVEHRGHRARPGLRPAPACPRSPPGTVARVAFWTVVAPYARGAARPDRQAPRPQRLRPRADAGLDAGAGAAAPPRHRRAARRPTSSGSPRRSSTPTRASARRRRRSCAARGRSRRSGRSASRATCRSCCCGSTTSRTSTRSASCCAPTSTGA